MDTLGEGMFLPDITFTANLSSRILNITLPSCYTFSMVANDFMTIRHLKDLISQERPLPECQLHAEINGKEVILDPEKTLGEYNCTEIRIVPFHLQSHSQRPSSIVGNDEISSSELIKTRRRSAVLESPVARSTAVRVVAPINFKPKLPMLESVKSVESINDQSGVRTPGVKSLSDLQNVGKNESSNSGSDVNINVTSQPDVRMKKLPSADNNNTDEDLTTMPDVEGVVIPAPIADSPSYQKRFRKRVESNASRISTLKQHEYRPKSQSDGGRKTDSPTPAVESEDIIMLKVTLPEKMATTIVKFPASNTMESLLMHLSTKKKFNFDTHTLAIPKSTVLMSSMSSINSPNNISKSPKPRKENSSTWLVSPLSNQEQNNTQSKEQLKEVNDSTKETKNEPNPNLVEVQLDRTLKHYKDTTDFKEVIVVPSEKSYNMVCVSEQNEDVMLLQMVRGRLQVMAAMPDKIIERMTDDQEKVIFLNGTFHATPPENPSEADLEFYNQRKIPTQKRVLHVLTFWVEYHFYDFGLNPSLLTDLKDFVRDVQNLGPDFRDQCSHLSKLIDMQELKRLEIIELQKKAQDRRSKIMQTIFLDIDYEEMAKQISLYDYKLFKSVHPIEFLNKIWLPNSTKDQERDGETAIPTPNLSFFIKRFDMESYWVATEICYEKDLKKRIKILKNFILITKECATLNNYFSLVSILGGLNLQPVQRLKKTWEGISVRVKQIFDDMEKVVDPSRNMKNLRDMINDADPPMIPFLPIYLKDLTFMNDGNPSRVNNMINFDKLRMMGRSVLSMTDNVTETYPFAEIPAIQNYLRKPMVEISLSKLKEASEALE